MATLLMVESWLQSTGLSLPPLIRERGDRYVLLTRDPSLYERTDPHPVIREADEIVVADTNDLDAAVAAARSLADRRQIDGVLTTCDYYLEAAAVIAAALGLPGSPPEAMRLATHKQLVRRALSRAGIPDAAHAVADDWLTARKDAAQIGYPLVAKPVDLNSGTSVRRIDDEDALQEIFEQITGHRRNTRDQPADGLLLMEELLQGPEVSVEAVTYDGQTTVLGITAKTILAPQALGRPEFIEAGHVFPAPLDAASRHDVDSLVRGALDAIGYRQGLSHTEVKLTPNGPRIVEINPRQAGGFIFDLVHLVTGTHPLAVLIDLALGRRPALTTATAINSAAVSFVMSPVDGTLRRVVGTERLDADPHVVRWNIQPTGTVTAPADNNDRIGYVLTADRDGDDAHTYADSLVAQLRLDVDGAGLVAPLTPGAAADRP